ncbi:DUF4856 domain-containing protein [Lewinella sp. 4G2]|uniref:DUF4856 domain-containing protein n=1 Tax=Lewinella sp. 4G2 TaxID=1803372 RepID=UPI0007B4A732|nr:DUF4856 domain-containing protein [Lewinella sp. 4G2]OAV45039.1 DUF4856 domain-containing protein [Lewinella sp. 4G2]
MTYTIRLLSLLAFIGFFASCEDDDTSLTPTLEVPDTYTFERAGTSTVSFSGQTTRLAMAAELNEALLDPTKSRDDLNNMFRNTAGTTPFADAELNASTKSVRSKVAASSALFATNSVDAAAIKADFDAYITGQSLEVFTNWNEMAAPGQPGQVADGGSARYVSALGLEYNQAFVKGLIGGLMYDQLANNYLDNSVLDAGTNRADNDAAITADGKPYTTMEHKWDEGFGYLFGGSATPATPLDDLGSADGFLNKYLGRVEGDEDYAGIAETVATAFRTGRAAIVAGDYAERDRQADIIIENLSDVIAIRAIYYLMQGKAALEANPQNTGGAFHDLSEGYGFIYSLRFIGGDRTGSDAYLLTLLNEDNGGFWTLDPAVLETLANEIGAAYGIDVAKAAQ